MNKTKTILQNVGIYPQSLYRGYIRIGDRKDQYTVVIINKHQIKIHRFPYCYAWKYGRTDSCCQWRWLSEFSVDDGQYISYKQLVKLINSDMV